jgi:hypothetical protein
MMTVFIDIHPELQKPGAEAAREIADLRADSLPEAVDALLAAVSTDDAAQPAR